MRCRLEIDGHIPYLRSRAVDGLWNGRHGLRCLFGLLLSAFSLWRCTHQPAHKRHCGNVLAPVLNPGSQQESSDHPQTQQRIQPFCQSLLVLCAIRSLKEALPHHSSSPAPSVSRAMRAVPRAAESLLLKRSLPLVDAAAQTGTDVR